MRLVNKSYAHLYGYDVINMPCRRISTQSHPLTKFKFKITRTESSYLYTANQYNEKNLFMIDVIIIMIKTKNPLAIKRPHVFGICSISRLLYLKLLGRFIEIKTIWENMRMPQLGTKLFTKKFILNFSLVFIEILLSSPTQNMWGK